MCISVIKSYRVYSGCNYMHYEESNVFSAIQRFTSSFPSLKVTKITELCYDDWTMKEIEKVVISNN